MPTVKKSLQSNLRAKPLTSARQKQLQRESPERCNSQPMIHESSSSASLEPFNANRKLGGGNAHLRVSPNVSLRFKSSRNTVEPIASLNMASGTGVRTVAGTIRDFDAGSASLALKQ